MPENVTLYTLAHRAAVDRFERALADVLANIEDLNTKDGKRTITLQVTFTPNENRDRAEVQVNCKTALQPLNPVETEVFIGRAQSGALVAREFDVNQMTIDDADTYDDRQPARRVIGER